MTVPVGPATASGGHFAAVLISGCTCLGLRFGPLPPRSAKIAPDGPTAYVTNSVSHTVSVITVSPEAPVFTAATPPPPAPKRAAYTYTSTATGYPPRLFVYPPMHCPPG